MRPCWSACAAVSSIASDRILLQRGRPCVLFVLDESRLYLAVPHRGSQKAEVRVVRSKELRSSMEHRSAVIVRVALLAGIVAVSSSLLVAQRTNRPQAFTLDDEMAMRSIIDVRIAPNGQRVAYVVSTPSLRRTNTTRRSSSSRRAVVQRNKSAQTFTSSIPTVPGLSCAGRPTAHRFRCSVSAPNGPQVFAIPRRRRAARVDRRRRKAYSATNGHPTARASPI